MRATLALGGEIDIVTPEELHGQLKPLRKGLDLLGRNSQVRPPIHDTLYPTEKFSMSAAGPNVVWFAGPAVGQMWNLTGAVWVAGDDHTPVSSGTVAIYKAQGAGSQAAFQLLQPGGASVPIPGSWYPPRLAVWLHPMDGIVIAFYGPANTTPLYAHLLVDKYMAADVEPSRLP